MGAGEHEEIPDPAVVFADVHFPDGYDAVADVRAMRDEDNRISDANWARREADTAAATDAEVEEAGQRLLTARGLLPAQAD